MDFEQGDGLDFQSGAGFKTRVWVRLEILGRAQRALSMKSWRDPPPDSKKGGSKDTSLWEEKR